MSTLSISHPGALNPNEINRSYQVITAPLPIQNSKPLIWSTGLESPDNYGNGVKKAHVIIVGAGISGLRAASVLQRHGVGVTILEGRPDRIGGRIHTSRKSPNGKARDIGKYT